MNHPSLEYYIVVAEKLNISQAALQLHITQQSLSAYVRKLEEHYGTPLLVRKPRMQLTREGALVYKAALEIRNTYSRLDRELFQSQNSSAQLSIGIQPQLWRMIFSAQIYEFARQYGNFRLNLFNESTAEMRKRLREGSLDVFFSTSTSARIKNSPEDGVITEKAPEDILCIAVRRSLLEEYDTLTADRIYTLRKGVELNQFSQFPIIIHPMYSAFTKRMLKYCQDEGYELNIVAEVSNQEESNDLIRSGVGFGFTSELMGILEFGSEQDIFLFPVKTPGFRENDFSISYLESTKHYATISALKEWVIRHLNIATGGNKK